MSVPRTDRINSLMKRVIGEAMYRVLQNDTVSPVLITVTDVSCAKDLRNATVRISVLGEEDLRKRALAHIIHHTRDFQQIVNREVRLKFTPALRFVLDDSIRRADETIALIDSLNIPTE